MKIVNFSFISYARKYELPEILEGIVAIVEKYKPDTLGINGMFQLLKAEMPGLSQLLETSERTLPQTGTLNVLSFRRNSLMMAIRNQLKVLKKADIESKRASLELVLPVFKRYLISFDTANRAEKSAITLTLLDELNTETLNAALVTLEMRLLLDELKTVQGLIVTNRKARSSSIAERNRSQMQQIKANVFTAARNLFKAMEVVSVEHPELDFSKLETELNNFLKNVSVEMKSRRTRRLNAIKNETVASTPTSTATASL